MSNTIFISGATGNIGSELVKALTAKNTNFITGVSSANKAPKSIPYAVINFAQPNTLKKAFEGVDTLFLLLPEVEAMFEWIKNIITVAKHSGIKHIVRSSGLCADIKSDYAVLRHLGEVEQMIVDSEIDYTITRPNSFMQNFATFDSHFIKQGTLFSPRQDAQVSFVDTRDIAAVNAEILSQPENHQSKIYNITGSSALSNLDAVEIISKAIDKEINYVSISDTTAINTMKQWGMPRWNIEEIISLYQADRDGLTANVTTTVQELTGREAITFERFAEDYADVWK
ncbi:MAG: SDR family oxidoreductase [Gloeocapsa sp. UFS-A4-WI-NPMV-4B04]|jgi:uncharacterized protein YbjT (DUF2867 family)|nr:SDR family oxidoreductase [Gloeocapsa sp. UFS-A4-WI-NPMV-4B04]